MDGHNLEHCEVPPRLVVLVAYDVIGLFAMVISLFLRDRVFLSNPGLLGVRCEGVS